MAETEGRILQLRILVVTCVCIIVCGHLVYAGRLKSQDFVCYKKNQYSGDHSKALPWRSVRRAYGLPRTPCADDVDTTSKTSEIGMLFLKPTYGYPYKTAAYSASYTSPKSMTQVSMFFFSNGSHSSMRLRQARPGARGERAVEHDFNFKVSDVDFNWTVKFVLVSFNSKGECSMDSTSCCSISEDGDKERVCGDVEECSEFEP